VNRLAAATVCQNATSVTEARELLEMIGLVEPGGTEILPDDRRNYDTWFNAAVPGSDRDSSPLVLSAAAVRGDRMTTPAGLRALPAVAAPAKPAKKRRPPADDLAGRITSKPVLAPVPEPTSEVSVPEPAPAPPDRHKHGTRGGYQGHRRRGEEACEPCRIANRDFQRGYAASKNAASVEIGGVTMTQEQFDAACRPLLDPPPSSAVDLDVWIDAAQMGPPRTVRALARVASARLRALHRALDDLARAERAAANSSRQETH
jgi:hypothetical protein